ncbi:hypothetical protein [Microbulbifer hydrolyticus]|uniref:Energy transducer TonB n=1 Tax=Microbulbifer hydrolyticus TaxID=48074 RepID=A0A6P1TAJ4_9GAMM|nr:hypothetical protein [Microbulbifer hydrolyticus]MBB5212926.1 hypothetical protein [Microbulbifer hydrolyticus]QHQ38289.1 hypothetical protein GTQ55_04315 [Microbulbifer hydrolyticus]
MNELQRTEYLTALGLTSYMPRFRLPLAPEPLQAPLPPPADERPEATPAAVAVMAAVAGVAADAATTPGEPHAQPDTRPEQVRPEPSADMGRVLGSITAETRVAPAASQVTPVAPPQRQVAPFVLSCWRLGEEVLAVDSREPGSALPVESLFGNIVRALGWHQLASERNKLRWPLAESPFAAAAGADDARDTCSSWVEAACARKPVKTIWLMGQQAQEFCAPAPMTEAVADWQGVRLVSMPSLTELLQEPARKREVWNLLRKLYPEQTRR